MKAIKSDSRNRPLPSDVPKNFTFKKEAKCTTFLVDMSFICMRMKNHFHEGWALNQASASVWFRNKERPRNRILGFGHARNETPFFTRSLTLVPSSLLLNRTETLVTQARGNSEMAYSALTMYDHNIGCCNNETFLSPKCDNFSGALSSKYSLEDFKNCDFCALSP